MSHFVPTPRMVNPRLAHQPPPVVYPAVNASPYYEPATLGRRQSMGHYPGGPQVYHVTSSDPSHSRGHHRSSSRNHRHRRSHSVDRHRSGRHQRHHRRSSTPSRSMPAHYSPETQYAVSRSPFDRIIGECRSDSKISDYSLQPSPPLLCARPPLPQLQP